MALAAQSPVMRLANALGAAFQRKSGPIQGVAAFHRPPGPPPLSLGPRPGHMHRGHGHTGLAQPREDSQEAQRWPLITRLRVGGAPGPAPSGGGLGEALVLPMRVPKVTAASALPVDALCPLGGRPWPAPPGRWTPRPVQPALWTLQGPVSPAGTRPLTTHMPWTRGFTDTSGCHSPTGPRGRRAHRGCPSCVWHVRSRNALLTAGDTLPAPGAGDRAGTGHRRHTPSRSSRSGVAVTPCAAYSTRGVQGAALPKTWSWGVPPATPQMTLHVARGLRLGVWAGFRLFGFLS